MLFDSNNTATHTDNAQMDERDGDCGQYQEFPEHIDSLSRLKKSPNDQGGQSLRRYPCLAQKNLEEELRCDFYLTSTNSRQSVV
jgi:hypothetical protein